MNNNNSKNSTSLCWYCKRCTNPDNAPCPWAERGEPVKGWTATLMPLVYNILQPDDTVKRERGYKVHACPLYINDVKYLSYGEWCEVFAKTLKMTKVTVLSNWKWTCYKYQRVTGEKLPQWVFEKDV